VIEGRWYQICDCFDAMSTHRRDCNDPKCTFSSAHPQPSHWCTTHNSCTKMMTLPDKQPIRISPLKCAKCSKQEAEL
ncbi:uncharacterized protein EI90DRAFT_2854487, partial [Cantharellus anzutake]